MRSPCYKRKSLKHSKLPRNFLVILKTVHLHLIQNEINKSSSWHPNNPACHVVAAQSWLLLGNARFIVLLKGKPTNDFWHPTCCVTSILFKSAINMVPASSKSGSRRVANYENNLDTCRKSNPDTSLSFSSLKKKKKHLQYPNKYPDLPSTVYTEQCR